MSKATKEKINQWKAQHHRVFEVSVIDDYQNSTEENAEGEKEQKQYHAYFHEPDFVALRAVKDEMKNDDLNASEMLYKACKIYADPEIEEVLTLKLSVFRELQKVVALKKTKFQKL